MALIFLRSLVFNLVFYVALVIWMIFALPTFLMPRPALMGLVDLWARSNIWLMRLICGIKVEYRGVEKIPKGPLIVAAKHQSMWDCARPR
jgi:1-acyl-sn-glycerol-3-phosphate acyltransferase